MTTRSVGDAAATTSVLRLEPRSNGRDGGSGTGPCGCRIAGGATSEVGAVSAAGASATAATRTGSGSGSGAGAGRLASWTGSGGGGGDCGAPRPEKNEKMV